MKLQIYRCRLAVKDKKQIMLVIDGSGSMDGSPIEQARESAELFIRDLPHGEGEPAV